jgi:V/A-type H+-transporting ATPase subunit C
LDYAYAVGRVRALEAHLISKPVFEEAVEERGPSAAMKVIVDAGSFRTEKVEFRDAEEVDAYLEEERGTFLHDIRSLFLEDAFWSVVEERFRPQNLWPEVKDTGYPFLKDYVRHLLDLRNLKLFMRARYMELPLEAVADRFLKGGFFAAEKLRDGYAGTNAEMGELLHATPYRPLWDRAVDTLEEDGTFADLERGGEDFMMGYLRRARQIVFGPEPVLAYVLARLKELEQIRLIAVGKLLQLPTDVLHRRICETYV